MMINAGFDGIVASGPGRIDHVVFTAESTVESIAPIPSVGYPSAQLTAPHLASSRLD
ncbi:hypothetical protein [Ferrimicrobium sp.]|uniref:hypothetical protein n=1 Tax=Ferrimicrobium sp. TaxID=2926050 RepID=UPI002605CD6C|nr:hypothetical protein [Ferrimicrobium sp.]